MSTVPGQKEPTSTNDEGLFSSIKVRLASGDLGLIPVIIALIVIWIVFQILNPHFLDPRNLSNLVQQIVDIGTLAIGVTFVLLLGEIDLSIAAVSGVSAGILVILATSWTGPFGAIIAIIIAILSGIAIGVFQGLWVTLIGVPAFIVTLAGSLGYQGILLALLGDTGTVPVINPTLLAISSTYLPGWLGWLLAAITVAVFAWATLGQRQRRTQKGLKATPINQLMLRIIGVAIITSIVVLTLNLYKGIPLSALILILLVFIFGFVTQSTLFGRHVYALGGNAEAARRAGIKVKWVKVSVFILAAGLAAVGGILGASRLGAASPATGTGDLLLLSIAAAIIGGTSLFGGRGSVYNALAGALVLGSVENGMDLLSAPSSTKYLIEGAILLIAVTIDTLTRRRRIKAGR
ncbi:ABC transporter permease [Pullulanibacillus camelliae]|uniref:Xylose transport system permease protein XylH n=1 Tax=Pullulanibacillus camelliae TaxID=1707096 RepID=A0A8J2YBA2_9BACL|nr:ABC transporter permease [Pullulanibacillus camelliae]GGE27401.1 ABC transporter permease [Pullulanibacillus camelliae]